MSWTTGICLLVENPNNSITLSSKGIFLIVLKIGATIFNNQISLGISDIILSLMLIVNFL